MDVLTLSSLALAAAVAPFAHRRLQLSRAKHPSLAGHSRLARRIASWLPGYAYDEDRFFACDGAPDPVRARRRAGFRRLGEALVTRHARTLALTRQARGSIPDLEFTSAYRVPFPFGPHVRRHLPVGAFVERTDGREIVDLDGRRLIDLTGSYGVNLFGHEFYRSCIADGVARSASHGVLLGAYSPAVAFNVEELKRLSGQDAVSFHMSGTEAVMQAVRLARFHTRRRALVRFCGAYHGWWDDVQPGPGTPVPPAYTYTLRDMDDRSLRVLDTRRDIACVLVNPLQALHPNSPAPGDSALVDSARRAAFDRAAYTDWLKRLREVCTRRGIVLILDEVFLGFRLAPGGAQQYFGVKADLVTYGKTVGGGLPVGVVCGRADLMRRFRDDRPADLCFARGTFNSHPAVMATMQVFLERLRTPEVQRLYDGLDEHWNDRAARLNRRLAKADLPLRVANLQTVFTVTYTRPSRYNWMLQFYLREAGLALSWVGSGRLIFSLDFDDAAFDAVSERVVAAATRMRDDGWWWQDPALTDRAIRRGLLRETLAHWRD